MRILFDPGVFDMRNKGNVALLQAAIDRIHKMWPEANLEVLTVSPHLLKLYCPNVLPVYPDHMGRRLKDNHRFHLLHRWIPRWAWRGMLELREAAWRRKSSSLPPTLVPPEPAQENGAADLDQRSLIPDSSEEIVNGLDLLVATGAQYMSDACRDDALSVLDRFEAAARCGIPTVMVGQGIGPIKDRELTARSKQVLPRVNLIFVRERTASLRLLSSLGVDPAHILITGDDAVEMVHQLRTQKLGNGIGIGLRIAPYTEVNGDYLSLLREGIQRSAGKYHAPLISIPISHSAHEQDDAVLSQVLAGYRSVSNDWRRFNAPEQIIRQVSRCRLVVAGTFHAIVFALAQGIPAVGLALSEMYLDKFTGLVDLFGEGLQIVRLDETDLEKAIEKAVDQAWNSAEQVRPGLLMATQKQIEMNRSAYRRIFDIVGERNF